MPPFPRLALAACLLALATPAPAPAQVSPEERPRREQAAPPRPPAPDAVTRQTLDLPGRSLHFTATAGFVRILDGEGKPEADIGMTAYAIEGADPATRPVTFVVNGGPGMSSAWLQMGAVGPWRVPMVPGPSASPVPQPNADTWLDVTDLVFVDPPGTGYGTILGQGDEARKRLWSVTGDVEALSQAIRRWLDASGRIASPKFLLGESYGGFRAPLIARRLAESEGVGLRGLVMASPVLDFGNRSGAFDLLADAAVLPSLAAATRAGRGAPVARADLADAEAYASGAFLGDAIRGVADAEALGRVVERVSALTGLDPSLVRGRRGLIDGRTYARERDRAAGRIDSVYDATVALPSPFPESPDESAADPLLDGLRAPVTSAMLGVYATLKWHPEGPTYRLLEGRAARQWDFGRGFTKPQALDALRQALALDPEMHVLVVHGLFDLVTPYFGTQMLLNQVPPAAGGDRLRLVTLPGGHMFYSRDESRRAFRAEAARLIGPPARP